MIHLRTPSRLHFGLFSLPSAQATLPRRQFGGVGLMIDAPGIDLRIEPAKAWSAEGPLADRALHVAQAFCASTGQKFRLQIVSAPPEHAGLGTGTQLSLAIARGIAELTRSPCDAVTLAQQVGRGLRSALGVHGFARGGFLVEGGKGPSTNVAPLLVRHDFPPEWAILLILPHGLQGAHGGRESQAFADLALQERDERLTEILCRLTLLDMLPALLERDLETFGESLYEFNRRVGMLFQSSQGGLYAHPRIEMIVKAVRALGIRGVGQSSWGPAIFAIVPKEQARELQARLTRTQIILPEECMITHANNKGVIVIA